MTDILDIGVIGVGFMGTEHVRVITEIANARLVAVSDIDAARAKNVAQKYKNVKWYTDFKDLLNNPYIQAVVIATPDHLHREPAVAAFEAGKDVFLEKPMASNLEDGKAILEASRKSGKKLMIGHICRFDPRYSYAKNSLEEGRIGDPILIYCRRHGTIKEARQRGGYASVAHYLSIHDIDQALWLLQDKPNSVYAQWVDGRVKREVGVSDAICITIKFKKGAVAIVENCWSLPENLEWSDIKMELIGTEGTIYIDLFPMGLFTLEKNNWKFPDMVYWPTAEGQITGALKIEDQHFVNCILEDRTPSVSGEDGLKSLKIVLAAQESALSNKPVEL